jgi:hypothetical protein
MGGRGWPSLPRIRRGLSVAPVRRQLRVTVRNLCASGPPGPSTSIRAAGLGMRWGGWPTRTSAFGLVLRATSSATTRIARRPARLLPLQLLAFRILSR